MFLIDDKDIEYRVTYLGRGKGGARELVCAKLGFRKSIDSEDESASKTAAFDELEDLAFVMFREGKYELNNSISTEARELVDASSEHLIQHCYHEDPIIRDIVVREMKFRGVFDKGLYVIGEHGDNSSRLQAIQLLQKNLS